MKRVRTHVTNCLSVRSDEIPERVLKTIKDELTFPNQDKAIAKRQKRYGWWDMADEFILWDEFDDGNGLVLQMPRGYALSFKQMLRSHGLHVMWIDHRTWKPGTPFGVDEFKYREHQPAAVDAMWRHEQGIYKAPTGSGKTVTGAGFIWEHHPENTIILVDRIHLVDQWVNRIHAHAGKDIKVGRIGDGAWDEERITVATIQSLYRHLFELIEIGFFKKHSVMILDECHHVTAEMFMDVVSQFWARDRLGMSATPDKTGIFDFALAVLGPIIYETTHDELRELGLLVEPEVQVIHTDFEFAYWGDHQVGSDEEFVCEVPGCKKSGKMSHGHRNNYNKLKPALVNDEVRNLTVAKEITAWRGDTEYHHQLIISDQTTHLDNMIDALRKWSKWGDKDFEKTVFKLTGKDSGKKRQEIIEQIEASQESIIFSTIAGEALDVAIIDIVHLPWPTKNARKTEQNIGRGVRSAEGKGDPVIIDYADTKVKVLAKQFRERRYKCYDKLGYKVVMSK